MRKYELIFAFILAMILMFLASCRSKQVTINEQVDSVSVSRFSLADIRSQMLDFSFDSMEIVFVDSTQMRQCDNATRCRKFFSTCSIKIKGGRIKAESNELKAESVKDSINLQSAFHAEKRAEPYKPKGLNIILICSIVFAIGIFGKLFFCDFFRTIRE